MCRTFASPPWIGKARTACVDFLLGLSIYQVSSFDGIRKPSHGRATVLKHCNTSAKLPRRGRPFVSTLLSPGDYLRSAEMSTATCALRAVNPPLRPLKFDVEAGPNRQLYWVLQLHCTRQNAGLRPSPMSIQRKAPGDPREISHAMANNDVVIHKAEQSCFAVDNDDPDNQHCQQQQLNIAKRWTLQH